MSLSVLVIAVLGLSFATTDATSQPGIVRNVTCPRAADIVLVLDQSTSIVSGQPNYDNWYVQILGFAKRIASAFPIDRNLTQIGLMKFSTNVEIAFHLNTYGDRQSVLNAIDEVAISGGDTNISAALRTARQTMFSQSNGARHGVPKLLILLTDGTANLEISNTLPEARLTKAANIVIYTVGVTSDVDEDQLREIASLPAYFFSVSHFTQLNSVLQELIELSCQKADTLPPTPSTTPATCSRAADIVLALDQSTSIVVESWDNWNVHTLGFAKRIVRAFPIGSDLAKIGLFKFNVSVDIVFHLNAYGDSESVLNAIDNIPMYGGDTNLAAALRTAREVMFSQSNGARPGVPKLLILLTDGTANFEIPNTLPEARLTKAANIKIYTVGVTNEVDEDQLREIASTPDYFFFASNFAQLNSILHDLIETSCRGAAPQTRI